MLVQQAFIVVPT